MQNSHGPAPVRSGLARPPWPRKYALELAVSIKKRHQLYIHPFPSHPQLRAAGEARGGVGRGGATPLTANINYTIRYPSTLRMLSATWSLSSSESSSSSLSMCTCAFNNGNIKTNRNIIRVSTSECVCVYVCAKRTKKTQPHRNASSYTPGKRGDRSKSITHRTNVRIKSVRVTSHRQVQRRGAHT